MQYGERSVGKEGRHANKQGFKAVYVAFAPGSG